MMICERAGLGDNLGVILNDLCQDIALWQQRHLTALRPKHFCIQVQHPPFDTTTLAQMASNDPKEVSYTETCQRCTTRLNSLGNTVRVLE